MSSRNSTPELRRREDDNPPVLAPPLVDERQRVREALFKADPNCPHGDPAKGRNLVVNIDGTSNQFSKTSTNVVELFSRFIKDLSQRVYYDSGIGTYTRRTLSWSYIKQVVDHKIDTAIAWNFEKIIHAAYKWIAENYEPGDRIYLFGECTISSPFIWAHCFSRGAYQVRVIAGMIEKVGLLHKGNDRQIPFAYELYCSVTGDSQRDASGSRAPSAAQNTGSNREPPNDQPMNPGLPESSEPMTAETTDRESIDHSSTTSKSADRESTGSEPTDYRSITSESVRSELITGVPSNHQSTTNARTDLDSPVLDPSISRNDISTPQSYRNNFRGMWHTLTSKFRRKLPSSTGSDDQLINWGGSEDHSMPRTSRNSQSQQSSKLGRIRKIWSQAIPTSLCTKSEHDDSRAKEEDKLCAQFKRSFCHEGVRVHFVGAWDTVSSIGVFRGKSFPETVSGMTHVCHFRHALALDERRVKFQPEYVNGGKGPSKQRGGDVKEVWFAGSHSDIGGGNISNEDLTNFGPSLRWMTYEAMACGLRIKPYSGKWLPVRPTESLTGFWRALEYLPFSALSYHNENSLTWRPHRGAPRLIQEGQLIHESVFPRPVEDKDSSHDLESVNNPPSPSSLTAKSGNTVYVPKAIIHESFEYSEWQAIFAAYSRGKHIPVVEHDPYENASYVLGSLATACLSLEVTTRNHITALNAFEANMRALQSFLSDNTYLASLVEVPDAGGILLTALGVAVHHETLAAMTLEHKETLVRLLSKARLVPTTARLPAVSQVYQWGSDIRQYRDNFLKVLQPFACLGYLKEGYNEIQNVAFSIQEPGRIIFTSSRGGATSIFIWDGSTEPRDDIAKVQGGDSTISRNGSHIAVRDGKDVSIIDATTQPPSTTECTDDEDPNDSGDIRSQCFSADNHTLATGHVNGWIKLWRREGDQWKVDKRFKGGHYGIFYLAFSRDGSRLAFIPSENLQRGPLSPTEVF